MRMIWANGVARLYATFFTVTGVRPRSHVQSNPPVYYLHEHACASAVGCILRKLDESEWSTAGQGLQKH